MDSPLPAVLPIPRLRLSRNAHLYETAGAGPSRERFQDPPFSAPVDLNHNSEDNGNDYDEDQFPTPRVTSNATLTTAETPAERLRAVLARVPTSARSTPMPHPPARTPSELDSDFEPPDGYLATPSMARESLKAIFSRAVRDPGDTPQKESSRPKRRNSIDFSEVEASPRMNERVKNKGKRRSMSDEEVEKPAQPSEASFRSSQAATFDILRERLTNSHTQIKDQHLPDSLYDQSIPDDNSHDTATILRDLNASRHIPPAATSTPQESLRMSANSQFQFESNLLEQDSEMRREIEGFDSYEDSGPSQRPVLFPPSRATNTQSQTQKQRPPASSQAPQRSQSSLSLSHSKTHSLDKSHGTSLAQRGSEEIRSSSRTSSSHSSLGHYQDDDSNQLREREREWNKPKTPIRSHTPELKHQHSHGRFSRSNSPMIAGINGGTLSRRNSATSLRSFDDDSSKGSSFGSQAEYRERINELERERNIEREREWNKPNPTLSRPRSSLSLNSPTGSERVRTHSLNHISRPDSAQPHSSVLSPSHQHRHNSFSSSSRASSPAGSSRASQDGKEEEEEEEVIHERERNWNAPRPKWTQYASGSRAPRSPPSTSSRLQTSTSTRVRAESLKTPGTVRGESPIPRGKAATELASLRVHGPGSAKKALSPRVPSPLPHERPTLSPTSSQTPAQTGRSRSPLPIPSIKGKEKENDWSQTKPPATQSKSQTPGAAPTPGSHSGYTFVRNRTPLPPIDFEKTPERPTPSHSKVPPPPSPTPGARPSSGASGSIKQSHIPVLSPKKEKTTVNGNTKAHLESPHVNSRNSESHSRSLAPPSFTSNHPTETQDIDDDDERSDPPSQERTPTIRTIPPPPPETPEHTPPRSPSPPPRQKTPVNDESRLQKAISSHYTTSTPTNTNATSKSLQEFPPLPSPPIDQPQQASQSSTHSFLSTPPRPSSFNVSRLEFQTPSPPKGLPELPGPPSSSEGDEDRREIERERTPMRDLRSDLTTVKTPRPPGAWASTPAPRLYHEPPPEDEPEDEQVRTPIRDLRSDFSTMKTPRAPGAWASTPAPPLHEPPSQLHSYAGDTDTECESGLATPVASLSRASSLPAQTPAPPGAWMATPTARKSILKVRFDTHVPGTEQSLSNDAIESSNDFVDGIVNASWRTENISADTSAPAIKIEEPEARTRTPEPPSTPVSPSRSPRRSPPRKSPSIRVLDAFGREQVAEEKSSKGLNTPRNISGIRVVDAMGRDIEDSVEQPTLSEADATDSPPLKHSEALVRVRQGLSDLAQGLDEMNRADRNIPVDYARLRELNNESRNSRATRERLSQTLSAAEADLRRKFEPLRASMKKNKFLPAAVDRRLSGFQMSPWMFWGALFLQLLLILLMYRVSVMRARNTFLTTYYDPFYPDLHLYVSKPDTIRRSMLSSSGVPWLSILDTLHHEGWKASTGQIWDNLLIMVCEWQRLAWEAWGNDSVQSNVAWPPT